VARSRQNDGAILIFPQSFLEYTTAQVVSLSQHHWLNGRAKLLCALRAALANQAALKARSEF
jgi:hypothetical protein